jgi:hypothetical protein
MKGKLHRELREAVCVLGLCQGDSACATVHPLPHPPPAPAASSRQARYQLRVPDGGAAGQDEEDRPAAPAAGAPAPAGSGSRARARWLLACTLGRNPTTAAYRKGGEDAGGAPRCGQAPPGPVPHALEPAADYATAVVEVGPEGERARGMPSLRSTARAAT